MNYEGKLKALLDRARHLRGEADRLAADINRDDDAGDLFDERQAAEALANAIDAGIRSAEGRSQSR